MLRLFRCTGMAFYIFAKTGDEKKEEKNPFRLLASAHVCVCGPRIYVTRSMAFIISLGDNSATTLWQAVVIPVGTRFSPDVAETACFPVRNKSFSFAPHQVQIDIYCSYLNRARTHTCTDASTHIHRETKKTYKRCHSGNRGN